MRDMKTIVDFLVNNPVQYLATIALDGKPKCRPFMFCTEYDGKLWFATNNSKEVYKELLANPALELATTSADNAWLRLSGHAVFEDNAEVKQLCLQYPIMEQIYQSADNPLLSVFYIDQAAAAIDDFSGNPPKEYTL